MSNPQRAICVDFDGTIVGHRYPEMGDLNPGAKEALEAFKALGYHIIIWSCRTSFHHTEIFADYVNQPVEEREAYNAMKQFLDDNDIPYDEIDMGKMGKPLSDYYIDDKAVRFTNNWPAIQATIEETCQKN